MTEIVIQRCVLRLVRHGGWSWGAEPRRLVERAVERLPALLAAELAGLFPAAAEAEIREPLRIRVPLRLTELRSGAVSEKSRVDDPLVTRIRSALRSQLSRLPEAAAGPDEARETIDRSATAPLIPEAPLGVLLERLQAWRRGGLLVPMLASVPPELLRLLFDRLVGEASGERRRRPASAATIGALSRRLAELRATEPAQARPPLRLRLLLQAADEAPGSLAEPGALAALVRAVAELLPPAEVEAVAVAAPDASPAARQALPAAVARDSTAGPAAAATERDEEVLRPRLRGEIPVASVLPWLILGPLSKIGYLRTLAATLELAGLREMAPALGAALAYKVLAPVERSWRRRPEAIATAAAFAGLADPLPEPSLVRLSQRLDSSLALLDAELAQATIAGREKGGALLLSTVPAEVGGGLLLLDPNGLFPVAWCDSPAELVPFLEAAADHAGLLLPGPAADPDLLRELDERGQLFVCGVRPTRGEPWEPLPGPARARWWTNRRTGVTAPLRRLLAQAERQAEGAERLIEQLAVLRRAVPLAPETALERNLTLAAAVGLGSIAWTLWREREAVDPVLALERFGDLDGHLRFAAESVRVRLPLGKRHRDLYEHGLLSAIADVPWLGGRRLEFSGG